MLFQPLKSGQKINRAFFNDLISFCNSLVLRGDGKTTQVTHTAGGTTVSAVIPEAKVEAAHRFRLFFSGGQCTVPAWPYSHVLYNGGSNAYQFYGSTLDSKTFATPLDGDYFLVVYGNSYSSVGAWAWTSGIFWAQGIVTCPVARCSFSAGELTRPPTYYITDSPITLIEQPPHPFRARAVCAMTDGLIIDSWTDIPYSMIEIDDGYVSLPKANDPDMAWTIRRNAFFDISDIPNPGIITLTMTSAGASFSVANESTFSGLAWDGSANTATIPIARWQNGMIDQYATSNIYAAPIYVP